MESILGNTRRPDVTFYGSGRIDITSRVAKLLLLHDGDVIDVGKQGGEFYLYVRMRSAGVVGKHEGRIFASKRNTRNFRAYSKRLCRAILDECGAQEARLPVGATVELPATGIAVPLITRYNLSL